LRRARPESTSFRIAKLIDQEMPRYLMSFEKGAMDHILEEDIPDVGCAPDVRKFMHDPAV
jgi:hypothetical protein